MSTQAPKRKLNVKNLIVAASTLVCVGVGIGVAGTHFFKDAAKEAGNNIKNKIGATANSVFDGERIVEIHKRLSEIQKIEDNKFDPDAKRKGPSISLSELSGLDEKNAKEIMKEHGPLLNKEFGGKVMVVTMGDGTFNIMKAPKESTNKIEAPAPKQ